MPITFLPHATYDLKSAICGVSKKVHSNAPSPTNPQPHNPITQQPHNPYPSQPNLCYTKVIMTKDDIITLPNTHLREKSRKVSEISEETKQLVSEMTSAALDWEASRPHEISAALAAIQVDHLQRVVIVRSDFDNKDNNDFTALINPEVVKYEGKLVSDYEGCLSVKDVYGKVPRYSKIRVRATTLDGQEVRFKAEGFLARVIQHEIDHTNGVVFIDHIKDSPKAFYRLNEDGELEPVDYEKVIKNNSILWD